MTVTMYVHVGHRYHYIWMRVEQTYHISNDIINGTIHTTREVHRMQLSNSKHFPSSDHPFRIKKLGKEIGAVQQ